jgi:hypothetical protein
MDEKKAESTSPSGSPQNPLGNEKAWDAITIFMN